MPGGLLRPDWVRWALEIAEVVRFRSEDPYVQVGAVLLRADNSLAAVGYNGAPPGVDIDWSDRDARRPLVAHAEVNALRYTTPADFAAGGLAVVTMRPCTACLVALRSQGINKVYFGAELTENYDSGEAAEAAKVLGVVVKAL